MVKSSSSSNDRFIGMLYDPPSGWMYGFPMPYHPLEGESLKDTLLRDGYPKWEIDNGGATHVRFIGHEEDRDTD